MLTSEQRVALTSTCLDCAIIPKVDDAGSVETMEDGTIVQIMHNGLRVSADGYCGSWMTQIIRNLRGHHEPQEELIFHSLLGHCRPGSRIVELGAYWSYYSLWYLHTVDDSSALCVEPNPKHLAVGRTNAKLNGLDGRCDFQNAWVGGQRKGAFSAKTEGIEQNSTLPMMDYSSIDDASPRQIELLHADIQGAEVQLLQSMKDVVRKPRFVVISTHHKLISGSAQTHDQCVLALMQMGASILTQHRVEESFSGDGLIVATFDPEMSDLKLPRMSKCRPAKSLFGPPQQFVSFAQNAEDVMLWRALKGVANGTYVDVGAGCPIVDSVTRAFYIRGWRGLNIEPNQEFFEACESDRPEDVNCCMACAAEGGNREFFLIADTGLSTMDVEYATAHERSGWSVEKIEVKTIALADLLDKHISGARPIHFLKIDVEGAEREVIEGNDWKRHRPWIVVVEATAPNDTAETHQEFEPLMLAVDYDMVYADGLNRFYLAREHSYLAVFFRYPPNFFDSYVPARVNRLQHRIATLEKSLREANEKIARLE